MSESPPQDIAHALLARDRSTPFGYPIHYFTEVGSTNDVAASLAERGAPQGTTVLASAQTAGRGRRGRIWYSPPEAGLYLSVICRNETATPYLTLAGGVAAADGIRMTTGLPVELKWPNDLVVPGAKGSSRRRKIGGILAEAACDACGIGYVVLGFGINLRPTAYPPALADRASSIETECGRVVDSGHLLARILDLLGLHFCALSAGQSSQLITRWRELAPSALGSLVECDTATGRNAGVTAGIADDGALLVRFGDRTERVIAGEIEWK
jgi:BirA family biotin operon repressor/biotin-[acetyl-CoA-carboxylase] ligase